MKRQTYILLILLGTSQMATAQNSIDWGDVRQAYFEKYHPTDTPAWIFPMVFEEGNGGRDTLYLLYDEEARTGFPVKSDTVFGERKIEVIADSFNVRWDGSSSDSILQVSAFGHIDIEGLPSYPIGFQNGILPLTMWWERQAFYSDSLPFPDQSPAPRGEGRLSYDLPMRAENCSFQFPILLTDSAKYKGDCYRTDSVYFTDDFNRPNIPAGILTIQITPWTGYIPIGIREPRLPFPFQVFPVPADHFIKLKTEDPAAYEVALFDLFGKQFWNGEMEKELIVPLRILPAGLYLLRLRKSQSDVVLYKKIFIRH